VSGFIRYLPLALLFSCAPRSVDRASIDGDAGALPGSRPVPTPPLDPFPSDAAGRPTAVTDASAARLDLGPDRARSDAAADRLEPAPAPPADAPSADRLVGADTADAIAARIALLVVGNAGLPTAGDLRLRQVLVTLGLTVRLASDVDPVDVTGVRLVVLAASCLSGNLGIRYRDLPLPILSTEPAVLDDLGMTGPTEGEDWEETAGASVNILLPGHQMAAGLDGAVLVVEQPATLTWGRPAPSAERVAAFMGQPERAAIFGYPRLAAMVVGRAPARRVGFFAADDAAASLTTEGVRLLAAAVNWVLRPS
jgi:hypothetical protein